EFHVQFDANDFSSRLRLSYRLRSRLGSRLYGSDGLGLASVAAEVQTDTNACHPLGFAVVDVVDTVHAATGIEVFGEVVLHACADAGEGGVVTTGTRRYVADALVSHASGNVRTQTHTRLAEVVKRVDTGVATFDVLVAGAVFRTDIVELAVGQCQ